ncbi:MAG: FeoB-associated Cys-rich membrane protein [Candidatus Adiutrix sp.]|jgi:hypothetical protein|nr:FeoB-associated Cys-rich membrane protein [Candidatus Adiutrix sp.]
MDIQTIIVILLVFGAAVYLIRKYARAVRPGGCGCGCDGGCSGGKRSAPAGGSDRK